MNTDDTLIGRLVSGKYKILSHIGSGAMGAVYLAENTSIHKKVALKVLHSDLKLNDELLQRFRQEGIAAGRFSHPNAIQIFDFDRDEDILYLAMEYIEGLSLKKLIETQGAQPVRKAVGIVRQVLSALDEAHRQGIIHRDLKPENIMVIDPDNEQPRIKILDFGISKLADLGGEQALRTQTGRIMGTPYYMAPEQFTGDGTDHRSDIFAAGLVLFELLAGRRPFQGDTVSEILFKHAVEATPPVATVNPDQKLPAGLDAIVARASQKRPDDRYQTAQEMIQDLENIDFQKLARPSARPAARPAPGQEKASSGRPALLIGGLAVVAVVVAAALVVPGFLGGGSGDEGPIRVSAKSPDRLSDIEKTYVGHLRAVREQLAVGKLQEAIDAANLALRLPCKDSEALLLRGRAYLRKGDVDTARLDFEEALQLDPEDAEVATALGWAFLERGDREPALARFRQALEQSPDLGEAHAGLGVVLLAKVEKEEARQELNRAVQLDPGLAIAHVHLGRMFLDEDKLESAADAFLQAKRKDATLTDAYTGVAEVYFRQGNDELAEQNYREAMRLRPDLVEARRALSALLISRDRIADATSLVAETRRLHPNDAKTLVLEGALLLEQGEPEKAVASLTQAIQSGAKDAQTVTLLGVAQQAARSYLAALESYRRAVLLATTENPRIYLDMGTCLFRLGRHPEARDALEKLLMLSPKTARGHLLLGILYMDYLAEDEAATQALDHLTEYRRLGGTDARVTTWIEGLSG